MEIYCEIEEWKLWPLLCRHLQAVKRSVADYTKTSSIQLRKRNKLSDTSSSKKSEGDKSASKKSDFNIHSCLKAELLGQHGGELLAEWKYSATNPYVTGIIACFTKGVYEVPL